MILGRVVENVRFGRSRSATTLQVLPFYRSPSPPPSRLRDPLWGIPAINTLSVTPLKCFFSQSGRF